MATGASTANLAIVLVDARNGVLPQSRRHAFIASLLGIPAHRGRGQQNGPGGLASRTSSRPSAQEFTAFRRAARLPRPAPSSPSARCCGDNVVRRARACRGSRARACCSTWKPCPSPATATSTEMRFPGAVRHPPESEFPRLRRPGGLRHAHAGRPRDGAAFRTHVAHQIASPLTTAICRRPSRRFRSRSASKTSSISAAATCWSTRSPAPHVTRTLDARLVWMSQTPLDLDRDYLIKHTTQEVAGARARHPLPRRRQHARRRSPLPNCGSTKSAPPSSKRASPCSSIPTAATAPPARSLSSIPCRTKPSPRA